MCEIPIIPFLFSFFPFPFSLYFHSLSTLSLLPTVSSSSLSAVAARPSAPHPHLPRAPGLAGSHMAWKCVVSATGRCHTSVPPLPTITSPPTTTALPCAPASLPGRLRLAGTPAWLLRCLYLARAPACLLSLPPPRPHSEEGQFGEGPHAWTEEPEEASIFSSGSLSCLLSACFPGLLRRSGAVNTRLVGDEVKRLPERFRERYQTAPKYFVRSNFEIVGCLLF